jgi:drug/metabolite transporter (DMT)-like permease
VNAAAIALVAAVVLAAASQMSKHLAVSFAHRQLIGPLLLLNCLLVVPFAFFAEWHTSRAIVVLQLASAATLLVGSFCMWDLFAEGSAAAVAVGQAITPVPALAFSFLLLAAPITGWQVAGDLLVTAAVLLALAPVFGRLSRRRAIALVLVAAALNGLLVVLTKMLTERHVGVAEIYVVRTGLAGVAACLLVPPRDIPLRALPKLTFRSALQSFYFVLLILAIQRGSPATVQTLVSTTPLMLLAGDAIVRRQRPPARLTLAALGVVAGVALAVT